MEDGISSFWGPVTSIDWCEKNYVHSSYIAEFFNTVSNIPGILLALVGLVNALRQRFEKRFGVLHISNMILAIGSMLYHATLQHVTHQGDETPRTVLNQPSSYRFEEILSKWRMRSVDKAEEIWPNMARMFTGGIVPSSGCCLRSWSRV
ncbi:hypothetical protein NL676_021703 [Syzygium grande]|nr:hypothetical protein NL676_021703 [Syzygium grande]